MSEKEYEAACKLRDELLPDCDREIEYAFREKLGFESIHETVLYWLDEGLSRDDLAYVLRLNRKARRII